MSRADLEAKAMAHANEVLRGYLNASVLCDPETGALAPAQADRFEAEMGGTIAIDRRHNVFTTKEIRYRIVEPFTAGPFTITDDKETP